MSRRSRNSPHTTGEETAQTNANINSGLTGNRGESSRRARCRGSGRRASNYCRENGLWAANTKTNNNQLKHEEIMSMMDRRSWERRQNRVTDEVMDVLKSYFSVDSYPFDFQQNFLDNKNFLNSK